MRSATLRHLLPMLLAVSVTLLLRRRMLGEPVGVRRAGAEGLSVRVCGDGMRSIAILMTPTEPLDKAAE